jgi:hypothetical protein
MSRYSATRPRVACHMGGRLTQTGRNRSLAASGCVVNRHKTIARPRGMVAIAFYCPEVRLYLHYRRVGPFTQPCRTTKNQACVVAIGKGSVVVAEGVEDDPAIAHLACPQHGL